MSIKQLKYVIAVVWCANNSAHAFRTASPAPGGEQPMKIARRRLLRNGAFMAAAIGTGRTATAGQEIDPASPPWLHEQGAPVLSPPYGDPSPYEKSVIRRTRVVSAIPSVGSSLTPLQDLHGIITPGGLHYERHHAGVPAIDPALHRLIVHGLVERPLIFTVDDLLRFP